MKSVSILFVLAAGGLLLTGCRGMQTAGEKQARQNFDAVAGQYRPGDQHPALPELTPGSSLSNFLAYALLNSPTVEATFYDWSASVENITVSRSLPDPQLTFQAYIQDTITSLMPGFAWNFPGPGKLKARAGVAVAESQGKYFAFESAMLQTAFNLKRAYYRLGLLDEQLRLKRETLSWLENQEQAVRAQDVAGSAALPDLLRVQSGRDRVRTELANLEDSHRSLLENFKAALGLTPEQADPPTPAHFETSNEKIDADELLRVAFEHNPQLKAMEADVRTAEAGMAVAYKDRVPDFSAALMADVKASPVLYWPQLSMSLPIWRDKIAAEVAGAKAEELAAQSRLKAGQIDLAVSFAEKSFAYRETSRNLALIENDLIPKARQSVEIIRAGYRTGTTDFSTMTDAEQMLLSLRLEAAEARTDRQIALADLSLMVAGVPPTGSPLLPNHPPGKPRSSGRQSAPSSRNEGQSRLTSAAARN
ncbi:MAG TPA: TolC family protein [Verrucomicrobiae bacterium]|nr:TolC family protein [Verrucomicrobiae bacterium]